MPESHSGRLHQFCNLDRKAREFESHLWLNLINIYMVNVLYYVKDRLEECRNRLCTEMYTNPEITDEKYGLLRTIYDSICKVEDLFI